MPFRLEWEIYPADPLPTPSTRLIIRECTGGEQRNRFESRRANGSSICVIAITMGAWVSVLTEYCKIKWYKMSRRFRCLLFLHQERSYLSWQLMTREYSFVWGAPIMSTSMICGRSIPQTKLFYLDLNQKRKQKNLNSGAVVSGIVVNCQKTPALHDIDFCPFFIFL